MRFSSRVFIEKMKSKKHFASFPILCTIQNNSHRTLTFRFVLSVNRLRPLCTLMLAKTGSTIPIRREYTFLPRGVSIFSIIRSEYVLGLGTSIRKFLALSGKPPEALAKDDVKSHLARNRSGGRKKSTAIVRFAADADHQ
jgi:hypothetical protein